MQQIKHKICVHVVEASGLPIIPEGYILAASVGDTHLNTDSFNGKGNSCRIDTKLVWEASKQDISKDCVELKESLESEHKTLRELMAKSERCKCRQESQGEQSSKQILLENERLRKENKALKDKLENESSLKEEIQLLTKELRNVANVLRDCDKSKTLYKEELAKIHDILKDICINRTESRRKTLDLQNILQKEYREMVEERREIESVKQSLYF
uniref:Uncharacterized protein n=1 Tax=Phlebotomus papatasi TaxID=29031 RepID=A0A1B0EXP7_PHLPP